MNFPPCSTDLIVGGGFHFGGLSCSVGAKFRFSAEPLNLLPGAWCNWGMDKNRIIIHESLIPAQHREVKGPLPASEDLNPKTSIAYQEILGHTSPCASTSGFKPKQGPKDCLGTCQNWGQSMLNRV